MASTKIKPQSNTCFGDGVSDELLRPFVWDECSSPQRRSLERSIIGYNGVNVFFALFVALFVRYNVKNFSWQLSGDLQRPNAKNLSLEPDTAGELGQTSLGQRRANSQLNYKDKELCQCRLRFSMVVFRLLFAKF